MQEYTQKKSQPLLAVKSSKFVELKYWKFPVCKFGLSSSLALILVLPPALFYKQEYLIVSCLIDLFCEEFNTLLKNISPFNRRQNCGWRKRDSALGKIHHHSEDDDRPETFQKLSQNKLWHMRSMTAIHRYQDSLPKHIRFIYLLQVSVFVKAFRHPAWSTPWSCALLKWK